ncbi:hypothetical protein ElyMa_004400000 [Elysia marginata]|uniref:Uncharacterized protein n=1 Tax=Elysia marginata TaxID=1093978 RepID=A0AAV4H9B3_9GAST|nr:hypothetical protein ElyMa_004400000 [Elysia marginata]
MKTDEILDEYRSLDGALEHIVSDIVITLTAFISGEKLTPYHRDGPTMVIDCLVKNCRSFAFSNTRTELGLMGSLDNVLAGEICQIIRRGD